MRAMGSQGPLGSLLSALYLPWSLWPVSSLLIPGLLSGLLAGNQGRCLKASHVSVAQLTTP